MGYFFEGATTISMSTHLHGHGKDVSTVEEEQTGPADDHALITRVLRGDNEAYDRLIVRHQEAIARQMRRYADSPSMVEELTQTVFVNAYLGLGKFVARAPFEHWLKSIASRVGYDHWRKEYKKPVRLGAGQDGTTSGTVLDGFVHMETGERLERIMHLLKPADRQTLYLLYVDDMSIAEAAKAMGWSPTVTKMRAYRARKRLRALLRENGIGDTVHTHVAGVENE